MKPIIVATAILVATGVAARAEDGPARTQEIWEEQCAKCHGVEGKGDTKMGKRIKAANFTDPDVQALLEDEKIFQVIAEGVKDEAGKFVMKPAKDVTEDQINALVAYIRAFAD
jgi:mono/diheme cytochrome c family protein